jgi:hypothetical protein
MTQRALIHERENDRAGNPTPLHRGRNQTMTAAIALARKVEEKCSADQRLSELLREIAAGNQAALAELYDRTSRTVFSLALRVLNDRGTAEEVTLEAYLQVWRHAQVFDERRGKPLTWLLTIARNKAIDRLRSATWKRHQQAPQAFEALLSRKTIGKVILTP